MSFEDEKERLISLVKRQVKLLMEEAVTKKYIHEDSSSVLSLCALVDACLSHGLKRRAIGLFRTNTTTALVQKLAKHFGPAALVVNLLNGSLNKDQTSAGSLLSSFKQQSQSASTPPFSSHNHGTSPLALSKKNKPSALTSTNSREIIKRSSATESAKRHDIQHSTTAINPSQNQGENVSAFYKPFYSSSSSSSSPSPFSPSGGSSTSGSPSALARFQWIKVALLTKNLTAIIEQIYKENSTYYERTALMSDPLHGPLLVSLLVGPCALEYSRLKICEQMWSDAPADELVQRHRIHNTISAIQTRKDGSAGSPKKSSSLKVNKNGNQATTQESIKCISSAKEYIESLHQNSKNSLIYGKNNVAVLPHGKNEPYYGYLSLHKFSDERLLLKWTPNQVMNTNSPDISSNIEDAQKSVGQILNGASTPDKSALWEYASIIDLSDIIYIHCHQKSDCNDSIILVGHDGVQRPPLNFPKGNHLLTFLTCLENGLAPNLKLDPPLWNHRKKGKIFPQLTEGQQKNGAQGGVLKQRAVESPISPHARRRFLRSVKTADESLHDSSVGSLNLRRSIYKGNLEKEMLPRSLDSEPEGQFNPNESLFINSLQNRTSVQDIDYIFRIAKMENNNEPFQDNGFVLETKSLESPFWNFWSSTTNSKKLAVESPTNRFVFPPTPPKNDDVASFELDPGNLPQKFWTLCHPFVNHYDTNHVPPTTNQSPNELKDVNLLVPPTPPPSPYCDRSEDPEALGDIENVAIPVLSQVCAKSTQPEFYVYEDSNGNINDFLFDFDQESYKKASPISQLTDLEDKMTRQSMNVLCQTMKRQILSRAFYGWFTYCKHINTVRTHLADLVFPSDAHIQDATSLKQTRFKAEIHACPEQLKYGLTEHVYALTQDASHRIILPELFLKAIYYGGVEPILRKEVWPYLLEYYKFDATQKQKYEIRLESQQKFEKIIADWHVYEVVVKERDKELLAAHLSLMAQKENEKEEIKKSFLLSSTTSSNSLNYDDKHPDENTPVKSGIESFGNIFRRLSAVSPFSRNSLSSSSNATSSTSIDPSKDENESTHGANNDHASNTFDNHVSNNLQQLTRDCQKLMINAQKSFDSNSTGEGSNEGLPNGFGPQFNVHRQNSLVLPYNNANSPSKDDSQRIKSLLNGYSSSIFINDNNEPVDDLSLVPGVPISYIQDSGESKMDQCVSHTLEEKIIELFSLNIHRIDKDVLRCDRNYWYFADDKNLEKLRNVVCSYVWTHLDNGYFQGMCDLAAPLLVMFDDEVMAYECFTNLMSKMASNFPTGNNMDTNFANMRSLIEILDPEVYNLMQQNGDYTHFYFCYRWFLLDFKRELCYEDVFLVWETIWAARFFVSDHFVLFIALAFVEYYRGIILENNMDFTDIIKFFNEMAEKHPAKEILIVARNLIQRLQCLLKKDE